MLWWLSHGEGRDTVTWCGWDKLKKGRNYWTSRLSSQVYGLRGVSWWLCVCFTWLDMTTSPWCMEKVVVYYYFDKDVISRRDFFFVPVLLLSILTPLFLPSLSVSLSCFILAVPILHETPFSIAILNGTYFFRSGKAMNNWKRSTVKQILLS